MSELPGLVLASGSPRRRELLAQLGLTFRVVARRRRRDAAAAASRRLDLVRGWPSAKAAAVDGDPVLAADTVVEVDGEILGKPVDAADARRMLRRLSGRAHRCTPASPCGPGDRRSPSRS